MPLATGSYFASFEEEEILDGLKSLLKGIHTRGFKVIKVDRPR